MKANLILPEKVLPFLLALISLATALAPQSFAGQKPQVFELWPGKIPDDTPKVGPERVHMSPQLSRRQVEVTESTRLLTDVARPSITVCRPPKDKDNGAAVLICPGGGYWNLYWQLEGEEVANWLNSLGVTGIILKYRVPRQSDEVKTEPARRPLLDAQRAVSLVRSKAPEWGIDPYRIGMIGFSAGGHLAIATATSFDKRAYEPQDAIDQISCRPDFAILAYPGYLKPKDKDELSPGLHVPPGTPPIFLAHGTEDIISPPEHSLFMYLALKRAGVPAELHIYSASAHDFGVRTNDHLCSAWTDACAQWLKYHGFLQRTLLVALDKTSLKSTRPVDLFSKAFIRDIMKQANQWQLNHPWTQSDRNWIRATWYTGVMAAYAATGDKSYLDQAIRWGNEHQWQPGTEPSGANVLTCAQTYLELFLLRSNRLWIEPTLEWANSSRSNSPAGGQIWYLEDGRRYVDSLYVGAPPLAMMAKITGDKKYLAHMNAFFWDVHGELFDADAGLFYRDKRFIGQKTVHDKKILWSRGNGWAFASLPRILTYLPPQDESRVRYETLFKQMARSLAQTQGADGLWRPNLGDADEFPMPETSGTGFFCYGLAWGIRNGLLERGQYLPTVKNAWTGLVGRVSTDGKVQWGQRVGDRPVAVTPESTHEYVTGTFLLAGSEMYKLQTR